MGVNFEGGVSPISPGVSSPKTQQPVVGKSSHRSVTSYPGQEIIGVKRQLVKQGQKALSQRVVTVVNSSDEWLLGRSAGGDKESAVKASTLKSDVSTIRKKEQDFNKAIAQFEKKAETLENGMKQKTSDKEVKQLKMSLVKAEEKLQTVGGKLNEKLDALENHIGNSKSGESNSVLKDFYDPPPDAMFGKQDKSILTARLEGVETLIKNLEGQLTVAQQRPGGEREELRIKHQLLELGSSGQKLRARIGSGKKFKQEVAPQSSTAKYQSALSSGHEAFRSSIKGLGEARIMLDASIQSESQDPSGKASRQQAEKTYKQAEANVSNAVKQLNRAESKLKTALEGDRAVVRSENKKVKKAEAKQVKESSAQEKSSSKEKIKKQGQTKARSSKASASKARQKPSSAQSRNLRGKQETTQKIQPEATAVKASQMAKSRKGMAQLESDLLRGHSISVKEKLGKITANIKSMSTTGHVEKMRAFIDKSSALPVRTKTVLKAMMNEKVLTLTKNLKFAKQCSGSFIDANVYGKQAQELISRARLNTLDKQFSSK